jgi:hypothetical protein
MLAEQWRSYKKKPKEKGRPVGPNSHCVSRCFCCMKVKKILEKSFQPIGNKKSRWVYCPLSLKKFEAIWVKFVEATFLCLLGFRTNVCNRKNVKPSVVIVFLLFSTIPLSTKFKQVQQSL